MPQEGTEKCDATEAGVNLQTCATTGNKGASELNAMWRDPTFIAGERATYYVRVLENPTCRWSTWDAIRADVEPNPALTPVLQERAWTSPIWVRPE